MDRPDTKSITTISDSSFYRKITKKYQTGKKKASRFPTMIFFKKRGDFFPKINSMILNFRLYLDQQNIVPVLILKKIIAREGKISRFNAEKEASTEKEALQSAFQIKNIRGTGNVPKTFLTSFKIPQEHKVTSEHFLTENISANKTPVFSFLKSLTFKVGNVTNNSNKILNSLFSPASSAFYQQNNFTFFPGILTLNSKILSYENNIQILNSYSLNSHSLNSYSLNYHSGRKIWYRLLNITGNSTFIDKENLLKYWPVFENKSFSSYGSGGEPLIKANKTSTYSMFETNMERFWGSWFSVTHPHYPNYFEKQNTILSFMPFLTAKNTSVIKETFSRLNIEKNCLKSIVKQKGVLNLNYTSNAYVSQVALKIPHGIHERSEIRSEISLTGSTITNKVLTGNIATNKISNEISVFSLLKSLIFRAENITNNSNKTLKALFSPVSNVFFKQKTLTNSPDVFIHNSKTLSYNNSMEILNSQISGKKICYRMLNIAENSTFIDKENILKSWSLFENKLPLNNSGNKNTIPSFIPSLVVKDIPVIKEIFSRLNTEKNCLKPIARQKDVMNNYTSNVHVSQAAFRILQGFHELLINSEKMRIITIIDRYFDRFRPFQFSTAHTRHDSFLRYLVFKAGNKITSSNRILKPQLQSHGSTYYQQAAKSTSSGAAEVSSQMLSSSQILNSKINVNSKINEKILNSQVFRANKNYEPLNEPLIIRYSPFFDKKSVLKNQPFFKDKLSSVLLQGNFLSNKKPDVIKRFFKESNWAASNGLLINNYYGNYEHGTPGYVQSNHNYNMRPESLVFQDQGRIEQEIEQIKRTIIETKRSVSEKTVPVFGEAEIKKYLDINRISSQVYQNIERTIRMEKERRGV